MKITIFVYKYYGPIAVVQEGKDPEEYKKTVDITTSFLKPVASYEIEANTESQPHIFWICRKSCS